MVEGKMCICWCPYVDICASNEEPFADWCLKWRKMTAEWSYNNVTSFTHHLLHTLPSLTVTWLCNYQHAPMTLQSSDLLQISPKLIREPALCLAYLCSGLWFVNCKLNATVRDNIDNMVGAVTNVLWSVLLSTWWQVQRHDHCLISIGWHLVVVLSILQQH